MSASDLKIYNQMYNNIERPYANIDLTTIPSWDIVMSIMEQQALEARRQMAKFSQPEQLMPKTITNFEFRQNSFNGNNSTEDHSDVSSCCSDEVMSDSQENSSSSDMSQSESDIEIDVDSIDDESDEEYIPSMDDIPITVLQLETKLREKELNKRK